ncbi:unnamed protein product [Rhodiola kirilowii]
MVFRLYEDTLTSGTPTNKHKVKVSALRKYSAYVLARENRKVKRSRRWMVR